MPVALAEFSAFPVDGHVKLVWATESETDNLGYILERKIGGSDWAEIASYLTDPALKGAGNTSSRIEYGYTDEEVLPGESYSYRLSDVDTKGNITIKNRFLNDVRLLSRLTAAISFLHMAMQAHSIRTLALP